MKITRLFGLSLAASLCISAGATAQHTGTHATGAQGAGPTTAPAQTRQPMPSGAYADTALLTGLIGTRAPIGIATVEGRNVRVTLTGDQPGSTRAWYVHRGTCIRDEGMIGSARAYTPIAIDARGTGTGSVALDAPFAVGGTYFVAVHSSATDAKSEAIVCGPLAKSALSSTLSGAHSMSNTGNMPVGSIGPMPSGTMPSGTMPSGTMPSGSMPSGSMGAMDHSAMGHSAMSTSGTGTPTMGGSSRSDSASILVQAIHTRMMADPVIRERAMTDPALRDMLAQMPAAGGAMMGTGAMPGMTMPPRRRAASRAATAAPRSTSRATTSPKPAATPARRSPPKPAAAPAPKNPMPSMPGMDHSKMPGMSKP